MTGRGRVPFPAWGRRIESMKIAVVSCSFHHPSKPYPMQYAGHSAGHLITVSDYDVNCGRTCLEGEFRNRVQGRRFNRQVIAFRLEGEALPADLLWAFREPLLTLGQYNGSQAIIWQSGDKTEQPFLVIRPGSGYPWESHWQSEILPDLLRIH